MQTEEFKKWLLHKSKPLKENTIRHRVSDCNRLEDYEGDLDDFFDKDRLEGLLVRLAYSAEDERRGAPQRHRVPLNGDLRHGSRTLKHAAQLYKEFRENSHKSHGVPDMIDYSWVPWFGELVAKIAESGESYLVEKAKAVQWGKDPDKVPLLKRVGENIDPLSFFYFLVQRNTSRQFEPVFRSVHDVFDIVSELPSLRPVIPTPPPNAIALFHNNGAGQPDLLWRVFRQAVREKPTIVAEDFNAVLNIDGVAMAKLTQALFIANPNYFLPTDNTNEILPYPEFKKKVTNHQEYFARMEAIKRQFPGCKPYEINSVLDVQSRTPLVTKGSSFFHINSDVKADGQDYWEQKESLPPGALTFRENNIVYLGKEREDDPRPEAHRGSRNVEEPKRGDIIFVRFGSNEGRGIGVVEQNGYYPDGWSPEKRISVYWINKQSGRIGDGGLGGSSFRKLSVAGDRYKNVRDADAYKDTFHLIEQWQKDDEGENGQPRPDSEDESGAEAPVLIRGDRNSLNTILFGPPGTGKTYEAVSHAVAIIEGKDPVELANSEPRKQIKERFDEFKKQGQIEFVTFHQNYTYEDFIEGIRPVLRPGESTEEKQNELTYELHDGIFKKVAQNAQGDGDNRYVLIIDEINRGNIAKIFGELITLLEPSKRLGEEDAARATLPYSGESFGVPNNLYILGTMNTADRSIALLDTALRRRFDFIEMMPNPNLVEKDIEGVDGQKLLIDINLRIKAKLDREHQIGHTYLIGVKNINALADAFQRSILPLLQEYFYDDWEKIQYVLNRNPFVRKDPSAPSDGDADRPMLERLPHGDARWRQAESYQQIYASSGRREGDDGG